MCFDLHNSMIDDRSWATVYESIEPNYEISSPQTRYQNGLKCIIPPTEQKV